MMTNVIKKGPVSPALINDVMLSQRRQTPPAEEEMDLWVRIEDSMDGFWIPVHLARIMRDIRGDGAAPPNWQ